MSEDGTPITAEKIADLALRVVQSQIGSRGEPFVAALGIATEQGMTFVEVDAPIERVAIRETIGTLAEHDGVLGFAYVAATMEASDDGGGTRPTYVVSALTRDGRVCKLYPVETKANGHTLIAAEPTLVSTVFLTWVFDGFWERCH